MDIENKLKSGIVSAIQSLEIEVEESKVVLQQTKKEFAGDFTFVVFPYVKQAKMAPPQLAEKLGEHIKNVVDEVGGYNVVQGFLNIELETKQWTSVLTSILAQENYGQHATNGQNIMVEYSSPNTNKPLHLGHLRNNFLGFSIAQVLKENGYHTIMANLVNDRGIHICKSMLAYEKFGNNETPTSANMKGDHLVGKYYVKFDVEYKKEIEALVAKGLKEEEAKKEAPLLKEAQAMLKKWEEGEEETVALWAKMNNWVYDGFNATYKRIGVSFDQYYYESNTYLLGKDMVEEGLEKGTFYKKEDHSVWCDLSDEGLDEKLVLRGDGTAVYMTQDMGTADLKYKDHSIDKSVYVVGNEQDYHFNVLQKIAKKLNRPYADGIYHMSYGMVDLPSGKMKSREGTVVDADDLISEMVATAKQRTQELGKIDGFTEEEANTLYLQLALGAIKYYILKVDPRKRMLFNPSESIDFQGNTGPFIQYTHARITALLRKASSSGIQYTSIENPETITLHETEVNVIALLNDFPKVLKEAGNHYAPSSVANYVYSLAKEFNRFYQELPIFRDVDEETQQFRVAFCYAVARTIKKSLALLGIEAPERM